MSSWAQKKKLLACPKRSLWKEGSIYYCNGRNLSWVWVTWLYIWGNILWQSLFCKAAGRGSLTALTVYQCFFWPLEFSNVPHWVQVSVRQSILLYLCLYIYSCSFHDKTNTHSPENPWETLFIVAYLPSPHSLKNKRWSSFSPKQNMQKATNVHQTSHPKTGLLWGLH